ncbi:MAG: hypothetical protein RLZZ399_1956 [Verrucomicrobiota bacterium]
MPGKEAAVNSSVSQLLCGLAISIAVWTQNSGKERIDPSTKSNIADLRARIVAGLSLILRELTFNSGCELWMGRSGTRLGSAVIGQKYSDS